jgi:hypothetical protein
LLSFGLCAAIPASSQTVPIFNASFEIDVVDDGDFNSNITPAGWSTYDPTGVLGRDYSDVGVLNPADIPPSTLYPGGAPDGANVALIFLWPQTVPDQNQPVGLQQTLVATLQAFTHYTLTVQVGNIAHDGSGIYSLSGFPGYQVQLFAGSTLLAQDNNTLAPTEGTFQLSTVQFTSAGAHAALGQALSIRLINLNIPNSGIEVNFDDVQLTAAAVPEPAVTALVFAGLALGAVICLRRRMRHISIE